MMSEKGYQGKITNSGVQVVKAPHSQEHTAKGTVIQKGTDLRTGNGGGKK